MEQRPAAAAAAAAAAERAAARAEEERVSSTASAEAAPSAESRKRRRKRPKPAGSKWLNRLLALGCLSCLVPLWWEYRHGGEQDHHLPSDKHDPWVREIDAVALGKQQRCVCSDKARGRAATAQCPTHDSIYRARDETCRSRIGSETGKE